MFASACSISSMLLDALRTDVAMGVNLLLMAVLAALCWCQHNVAATMSVSVDDDGGRHPPEETNRPVIGVLSMELSATVRRVCGDHDSYIAASYVKFVEGAGARVAPILIGQPAEYYRKMARSVNGLLLPGGATYFDEKDGYAVAGKELYKAARELNEREGVHFPVLGICLGMELLAVAAALDDPRVPCEAEQPLPLTFLPGSKRDSRLFAPAPPGVIRALEKDNVTVNHHRLCITREGMERQSLTREWRPLTVNKDEKGLEYVSVFEHKRLPLYGIMFHPEKNIYEWKSTKNYPHSSTAVASARYFADFLVSEARRNRHSFPVEEEKDQLIYRHQPTDTRGKLMWEQLYFFSHPRGNGTPAPPPHLANESGQNHLNFDV